MGIRLSWEVEPMSARPAKAFVVRDRIAHYIQEYTKANLTCTKGQRGAVQKHICFIWNDPGLRHLCVWWLMGAPTRSVSAMRMSELNDAQVMALKMWINAKPDDTGAWQPDAALKQEATWIQWEAERVSGMRQQNLLFLAEAINEGGQIAETGADP
jgi:hypothetical protein